MNETHGDATGGWVDRIGQGWNRFWFAPSDPVSLCVLRVVVGVIVFYTLLTYSPDLDRFFTEGGMLPLDVVREAVDEAASQGDRPIRLSYFNYLFTSGEVWAAHVIGLAVVAMFVLGVLTRVTSIASLIVLLSYVQRAPMLTSELEWVLAMLMLYLCIGPCGRVLSVDAWLRRRRASRSPASAAVSVSHAPEATPSMWATVSLRLVQLHLCLIYVMIVASKLNSITWWDGTAVGFLATGEINPWIDFRWIRTHNYLMNAWTHFILLFEITFPILIWNRTFRPLLLVLSILSWGSLLLVSGLITYCLVMMIAGVAFVPAATLRRCVKRFAGAGRKAAAD